MSIEPSKSPQDIPKILPEKEEPPPDDEPQSDSFEPTSNPETPNSSQLEKIQGNLLREQFIAQDLQKNTEEKPKETIPNLQTNTPEIKEKPLEQKPIVPQIIDEQPTAPQLREQQPIAPQARQTEPKVFSPKQNALMRGLAQKSVKTTGYTPKSRVPLTNDSEIEKKPLEPIEPRILSPEKTVNSSPPKIKEDLNKYAFCLSKPKELTSIKDWEECYHIIENNKDQIPLVVTIKCENQTGNLDIEPFFKLFGFDQKERSSSSEEAVIMKLNENYKGLTVTFQLKNGFEHIENMTNTIQSVKKHGLITPERADKLGIKQTLSNDILNQKQSKTEQEKPKIDLPTTVCLNHIFGPEGIRSSLYHKARGGLKVALERDNEKEFILDNDLNTPETLNELTERAHQTVLFVIPYNSKNDEYAKLTLTNSDGEIRSEEKGVYITKKTTQRQSTENTVDDSIAPSNFSLILVPERMGPFLELIKTEEKYKFQTVPSHKKMLHYKGKKMEMLCPDYENALVELLKNEKEFFIHVLKQPTNKELELQKRAEKKEKISFNDLS